MNEKTRTAFQAPHRPAHRPDATDLPPIHPGEVLKAGFLQPMGLSVEKVAAATSIPATTLRKIIDGEHPLTADLRLPLSRYLGAEERLWDALQKDFDREVAALGDREVAAPGGREVAAPGDREVAAPGDREVAGRRSSSARRGGASAPGARKA